jgi:hypothetical protein
MSEMAQKELAESALSTSIDRLKDVNAIKKYKDQLFDNSDEARNLGEIISRLTKSYESVKNIISAFTHLSFGDQNSIDKASDFLFRGKYGHITNDLMEVRTRCTIIEELYDDFLDEWFQKKLQGDQAKEIRDIFKNKLSNDYLFRDEIDNISKFLKDACKQIYPMVDNRDFSQASMKLREFSKGLDTLLDNLTVQWEELRSLEAEFREKTRKKRT